MNKSKIKEKAGIWTALAVIILSVSFVYLVPRAKYKGAPVTSGVLNAVPENVKSWQGTDISGMNNQEKGHVYNFISRIVAYQYENKKVSEYGISFIILDAGNFHYPKVCFKGSGFVSEELPEQTLRIGKKRLKVRLLLNKKKNGSLLTVYWICIDKHIVRTWTEQKIKQLYYSLFNKDRVGLMIRVDVPLTKNIKESFDIAEEFLNDLYDVFPLDYRDYIFSSLE